MSALINSHMHWPHLYQVPGHVYTEYHQHAVSARNIQYLLSSMELCKELSQAASSW